MCRATLVTRGDNFCTYKATLGGESEGKIKYLIATITGYDGEENTEFINSFTDSLGNKQAALNITKQQRTLHFKLPGSPMAIGIAAKLIK
jgi:hypothetical protein